MEDVEYHQVKVTKRVTDIPIDQKYWKRETIYKKIASISKVNNDPPRVKIKCIPYTIVAQFTRVVEILHDGVLKKSYGPQEKIAAYHFNDFQIVNYFYKAQTMTKNHKGDNSLVSFSKNKQQVEFFSTQKDSEVAVYYTNNDTGIKYKGIVHPNDVYIELSPELPK